MKLTCLFSASLLLLNLSAARPSLSQPAAHSAPHSVVKAAGAPNALACESLLHPIGVDAEHPRLSWKLEDPRTGARQTAYQLQVATRADLLAHGKPDTWDTGRVPSAESAGIPYTGPALNPETRYFWRVRVWDQAGNPYPISAPTYFETGIGTDWHAQWIGYEDLEHRTLRAARPAWITNPAVPTYKGDGPTHHNFRLQLDPALTPSGLRRAVLYVTGEDTTSAWINGQQVLTAAPQPKWGRTPWRTYASADVTSALKSGASPSTPSLLAIDILHYGGHDASQTPMSAELYLEMADGTARTITTDDPKWKATLNAEGDWHSAQFADTAWAAAVPFPAQADAFGAVEPLGNPLQTGHVAALRHNFTLASPVRSARLYATALGAYTLRINGSPVGDQVLAPGWTDFRQHTTYQAYDVTPLLHSDKKQNAIAAWLAPGWYSTPLEWVGQGNNYGNTPPALRAQLRMEHTDGTIEWINTDATWQATDSPITTAEIYDGETFDARKQQPGWDQPAFATSGWEQAAVVSPVPPSGSQLKIDWQSFQPIRAIKSLPALTVKRTPTGSFIYDFGQELAGVATIDVAGKPGTDVRLRFAEVLNDDGTLYIENLRNAKATDHFILAGKGSTGNHTEHYQPTFTFHGFRYVEVSGIDHALPLTAVKAIELHTDAPDIITLKTGSTMVNKLWSNILWGQRSNFVGVPTDCPQRDERLGWTADAQVFWRAASFNMDLAAFSRKYAADLRGTQATTPMYGIYAPGTTKPNNGFGPGWSDAGIIVPWTSWIQTGDPTILAQNWDSMQRYLAEIARLNPDHLWKEKSGIAFGDWLSPEGTTSQVLVATAYYAYDVSLMQQMALALGKADDAHRYAELFEKIRKAFEKQFVGKDGFVGLKNEKKPAADGPLTESQTGYVLALHMNLLPEAERPAATKRLVDRIAHNGGKLATGFLGTPYLLEVLTEGGYPDIAYQLLLNRQYPSWGYMVDHGATTMWERWNGDAMRSDPGMNSYNHYAYGAVAEWIYRYAAGIDTTTAQPGFHVISLHPAFDSRLGSLDLTYQSPYGPVHSAWKTTTGHATTWTVTLPPNTTGVLALTPEQQSRYTLNGKPVPAGPLPAGTHIFNVTQGSR